MKKLILGLGNCGNNIINLIQDRLDNSYKSLSIQKDLQLLAISKADFKLNIKDNNFEKKFNTILNFSDNISLVAGLGGSSLFLYIEMLLKIIKKNKKTVTLYLTTPNSIEGSRRIELSNQTVKTIESISTISFIFKNDKLLDETDDRIIDALFI